MTNYKLIPCPDCGAMIQMPNNLEELTCPICEIDFYNDIERIDVMASTLCSICKKVYTDEENGICLTCQSQQWKDRENPPKEEKKK